MKTIKNQVTPLWGSLYVLGIFSVIYLAGCSSSDEEPSVTTDKTTITSMSPTSPANLVYYQTAAANDRVSITYDYQVAHAAGARIWVQPYTNGSISDDFLYSSSQVFTGSGTRTVIISIDQGSNNEVHVDELRIIMTDPDQNVDLYEQFVPVDYTFSN